MRRWPLSLCLLALVAPGCGSSSSGGGTGSAQTTITVTSEGLPSGTRRIRGTVRDASGLVVAEPRDELLEAGRDTVLTLESGGAGNGTVFLEALRPGRVVAATTTVDLDDDRLTVSGSAFTDLAPRTVAISVLHAGLAAEATRIRVTLRSATTGESIVAPRTVAIEAADETTVLFPSVLTSSGLDARCEALRADGSIVSTRTTRVSGHGVVVAGASFVPPDFSAPPPSPTGFDVLIDPKNLQPAGSPLQSSSIVAYWFDPQGHFAGEVMVDVDPQKTLTVHFPVEFQRGVAVSLGAYDSSGEQLAFWFPPSRVLTAVTTTTEAKDWVVDTTIDFPSGNPEHDYPAPTASSPVPITPAPVRVQFAYQNANGVWYLPEFPWQTMMTSKLLDADLGSLGDDVYPPVVATTPAGEPDVYTLPGLRIESGPGIVVGSYYSLYFVQSFVKPPPVAVDRLPSAFGIYPPFRLQ